MRETLLIECNQIDATFIQDLLGQQGILSRVEEPLTTMDFVTGGGTIPVWKIFVNNDEYDKAKEICDSFNQSKSGEMTWCPVCGSEKIKKSIKHEKHGPKWMLYVIALFLVLAIALFFIFKRILLPGAIVLMSFVFYFIPHNTTKCKCEECGHVFTHY